MLREEPEVIYGSAFEIDSYINIFEVLSEMISEKTIRRELLITLISRKNLLKDKNMMASKEIGQKPTTFRYMKSHIGN